MERSRAILVAFAAVLGAVGWSWTQAERNARREPGLVVFSPMVRGCPVIVPASPNESEWRAAALISETLALAAGRDAFPVVRESRVGTGRGIYVGATKRGANLVPKVRRLAPFDDVFAIRVEPGGVLLGSVRPEAAEIAVAWWLEAQLGAHWFMPGSLGTHVPARSELRLMAGERWMRPAFLSRSLGVDAAWGARNKLEARIEHGHSYNRIFTREDLLKNPELAPMRAGQRFIPEKDGFQGWQPDLASPAAVTHAADHISRAFTAEPGRTTFALCQDDSDRYDDSATTLARLSPLRWFRKQPDYTPLVFRFTNAVADRVRAKHPDKLISAYAYDWTENAPDFRIAPNVVPFLTADRSQWFEPEFAAEDRATMTAWVKSGPRIVGTYDYYEGAPYLVPRTMLYGVAAIREIYAAGVRAFYGEGTPNWGLDGPKLWLAAQLQWDPRRPVAELLDVYYREFWQEAAAPMRAFFDQAERAWLGQPRPGFWIKYYWDEHQALLFPEARRREMRAQLDAAARAATSEVVRARVAFVRDAFAVSDAFAAFSEARDALTTTLVNRTSDETSVLAAWRLGEETKQTFVQRYEALRRSAPLAIQTDDVKLYLRYDPTGAVRRRLAQSATGRRLLAQERLVAVEERGPELLKDPAWAGIEIGPVGGSTTFEWAGAALVGSWRGHGDPFETRTISWGPAVGNGRAIRFAGCKTETFSQTLDGMVPGQTYVARVGVRAKVSPANATFLILTFFDENFQPFELGHTMRLPVGERREWSELAVVVTAPPKAHYVGVGVRVVNQVNDDFAEFAGLSLRVADETSAH